MFNNQEFYEVFFIKGRVNNSSDQFLIKPIGLAFHEVTGSSLVKVDSNGKNGKMIRIRLLFF
jgi:ribulose-5-phosphate 4-epimerase/fuculose-1-phosphate aldolase